MKTELYYVYVLELETVSQKANVLWPKRNFPAKAEQRIGNKCLSHCWPLGGPINSGRSEEETD